MSAHKSQQCELAPGVTATLVRCDDDVLAKAGLLIAPTITEARPARCAGILFHTAEDSVLLLHRTDGAGWAFPGGHLEGDENIEGCARRETEEETGRAYRGKLELWTRRVGVTGAAGEVVDFTTFAAREVAPFIPVLCAEHDGYTWVDRRSALASMSLHPGAVIALKRAGMHELDIARAMRDGDLTSPQRYINVLLVAIRITGTGGAYRGQLDEFVHRDKSIYLADDFLHRCYGLPVIVEHPDKNLLTSAEYKKRNVGSVFLPFIRDDEVWCIAKIWNAQASNLIETEQLSTSPGIQVGGDEFKMPSGSTFLREGVPTLVDHLALLDALGVWDKGGPMAGVASMDAAPARDDSSLGIDPRIERELTAAINDLALASIS